MMNTIIRIAFLFFITLQAYGQGSTRSNPAPLMRTGRKIEVIFGGMANAFMGNPGRYLYPGGGMKTELLFTGTKGIGGGLIMDFYGNKSKQDFPIASDREQASAPPTLFIGFALNKELTSKERSGFNVQADLAYVFQNITPRLDKDDTGWTQLQGFSPGLAVNYFFQLGKNKTSGYYGAPSLVTQSLNIHGAVRPLILNLKQATGFMAELGLSYRLGIHQAMTY